VMIYLAGQPSSKRVSLPELAAVTATPESFLSKVLQALTHGGLLVSQRGQTGGFEISPRGRCSSMRDVVEAVDGPIHLNLCLTSGKSCSRQAWCPAHPVWEEAQRAMLAVLERALIAQLAAGPEPLETAPGRDCALVETIAARSAEESDGCTCGHESFAG